MHHKLLLIDDDTRLTDMVADYLRAQGYAVETAPTLAGGRELLRQGGHVVHRFGHVVGRPRVVSA